MTTRETKLRSVLRDYGYRIVNDGYHWRIYELPIKGHTGGRMWPDRFSSAFAAADSLNPIIQDDRLAELTSGLN